MSQTRLKQIVTMLKLIIPKPSGSLMMRQRAVCAPNPAPNGEELIPYSAKDLKYMWTLWDEAQRQQQARIQYRNIYVGAVGVILTGWFMQGLSFFSPWGGILMLVGALIGIWFCLKSHRQRKNSAFGD